MVYLKGLSKLSRKWVIFANRTGTYLVYRFSLKKINIFCFFGYRLAKNFPAYFTFKRLCVIMNAEVEFWQNMRGGAGYVEGCYM